MKVNTSPPKEDKRKISIIEQKLARSKEKNRALSQEAKYLRRRVKELQASRDKWKAKNKDKALRIRHLKKASKNKELIKRHYYPKYLISLCIHLRVYACCSYRSISRILLVLKMCTILENKRLPCANTVENWVTKMGYYLLEGQDQVNTTYPVGIMIDELFGQGNERIIAIVSVPFIKDNSGALRYEDVQLLYLGGQSSWTSQNLEQVISQLAKEQQIDIKAIMSDEDAKLVKTAHLLDLPHLPDINHALATCLRKTFEKDDQYKAFIKQIAGFQSRSVNQHLSYLRPPKQRVKARFMNQKACVYWALELLHRWSSLNQSEQHFFAQLPNHRPILKVLKHCLDLAEFIAKLFKTQGLKDSTLNQVEQCIEASDSVDILQHTFIKQVQHYLDQYRAFIKKHRGTFHVSTDILESLFGKYKQIQPTNPLTGISRLSLELPLHCLNQHQIEANIKIGLETTFMNQLNNWVIRHSTENQAAKRKKFFNNRE